MRPKTATFSVLFPIYEQGKEMKLNVSMKINHFPVLINNATTGHKLQGKSLTSLVIAQWSKKQNWAYVVLSQVKPIQGLSLLSDIPDDIDFSPDKQYLAMMQRLRNQIAAKYSDIRDLMEKLKYLTGKKLKEIISHKNLFQLFIIETII